MEVPQILTRKLGPLPGWAWGGLGLGLALAWSVWQRNRQQAESTVTQSYELPETLQPTYVFQNYDQDRTVIHYTPPDVPPGGGRTSPPITPTPLPQPIPETPTTPAPAPTKPAPAPNGIWVTIVPWKPGQPAGTPSTLWGVAEKVYGRGKGGLWKQIWSAAQNKTLRDKRKLPEQVRPGDKVWVPQ